MAAARAGCVSASGRIQFHRPVAEPFGCPSNPSVGVTTFWLSWQTVQLASLTLCAALETRFYAESKPHTYRAAPGPRSHDHRRDSADGGHVLLWLKSGRLPSIFQ